jgi:MipA family protein
MFTHHCRTLCLHIGISLGLIGGVLSGARAQSPASAQATEQASAAQASDALSPQTKPLWEIGALGLVASQSAYPGASAVTRRAIALPFFVYRGQVLRADQNTLGLRAIKTPRYEVDVGFSASLGSSAQDVLARAGLPDLGTLIEFGPRLKINLGDISQGPSPMRLEFPVRGVFDVSNRFALRGISIEPQWAIDLPDVAGWTSGAGVSLLWGSQKLGDTFYGVPAAQATATRPAYAATAGLIATRLSWGASRKITPDLRLLGYLRAESVAGAANRSSALIERNTGLSAGIGLVYTLGRSARIVSE